MGTFERHLLDNGINRKIIDIGDLECLRQGPLSHLLKELRQRLTKQQQDY